MSQITCFCNKNGGVLVSDEKVNFIKHQEIAISLSDQSVLRLSKPEGRPVELYHQDKKIQALQDDGQTIHSLEHNYADLSLDELRKKVLKENPQAKYWLILDQWGKTGSNYEFG